MKSILLIFVILFGFGTIQAQEQSEIGPKKGTVTASLLFGKVSTYATNDLPVANLTSYSVVSPISTTSLSGSSVANMIGVEGKYFFSNTWAVRFNGATLMNATPAHEAVPGVSLSGSTIVPSYSDIPARANADVMINLGVDKYFATKNSHLFWYASPVVNFVYNRKTGFEVAGTNATTDPGTTRYAEGFGIGLSGVAGAEYYTTSGIVVGFELRGVSYSYNVNSVLPSEGLKPLRSECHNITFLSQPTVKIGFKF